MYHSRTILSDAVERASMAGGIYPTETRFEAAVKRGVAKALAYAAKWLDPEALKLGEKSFELSSQAPR